MNSFSYARASDVGGAVREIATHNQYYGGSRGLASRLSPTRKLALKLMYPCARSGIIAGCVAKIILKHESSSSTLRYAAI